MSNSDAATRRCEDCGDEIEGTPRWYYGDAYHHDCLYEGLKCDGCGVEIENESNLAPVEVDGETEQWCPGCRGAAGGRYA